MHFHQIIHKYLLDYREKHNNKFNFLVRQKTSAKDEKYPGGKFAHGLFFQGNDKYCFVGLSNKSGGVNSTRSIGIVIKPTKKDNYQAHFEIVFPGEQDHDLIAFYKDLATKFEHIEWNDKGEKAVLPIGEFSIDNPLILYNWLDMHYPMIRETTLKSRIENIIPDDERFEKLQDNLEKRLKSDKKPVNYWIYSPGRNAEHWNSFYEEGLMAIGWDKLGDLSQYETKEAIHTALQENYGGDGSKKNNVSANFEFAREMKVGDVVIVKKGRNELLGYGIVSSDYYHDDSKSDYKSCRDIDWKLNGNWKTDHSLVLKTLTNITEYKSDDNDHEFYYQRLMDLMKDDNSFEKTRAKLDRFIFDEYIAFVRSIIKDLDLKPNDPRVVYSLRNDRLNFTVGQKYCANIYTSKKKGNFGVISTNKLSQKSEEFAGENPKTYYSYLDKLEFDNNEFQTIKNAINSILDTTTQSGYLKHNDIDFQNYLFGFNTSILKEAKTMENLEIPSNKILYGPPGTGKTYYLKDQLFNKYTLKETSISHDKFFEEIVADLTWWQVAALALMETGTARVNDILENRWTTKKASISESKNVRATIWGTLQMHTVVESKNVAYTQRQAPFIFDKNEDKTWKLISAELDEQAPELKTILDRVNNFKANPDKIIKNYSFVTFHQSFAYEDFIEGIKPILPENETEEATDLGYTIEDGVFKQLCTKAKNDPDNRYAIFIDEINRGNVSAIFGELITLIELDKRKGAKNELSIKLPYSKKDFSVPSNLDIYATMNTADRSVEALDTALRRRFEFKEMMPDYTVIENEFVEDIQLSEVLETINQRIELLIDRDHTIGHSYFVNVSSPVELANAFNNKVLPLLQEYFYGDYGKIGLVLGSGFVKLQDNKKINFAKFKYENANDFKTPSYQLKQVNRDTVIAAVDLLLDKNENDSE